MMSIHQHSMKSFKSYLLRSTCRQCGALRLSCRKEVQADLPLVLNHLVHNALHSNDHLAQKATHCGATLRELVFDLQLYQVRQVCLQCEVLQGKQHRYIEVNHRAQSTTKGRITIRANQNVLQPKVIF